MYGIVVLQYDATLPVAKINQQPDLVFATKSSSNFFYGYGEWQSCATFLKNSEKKSYILFTFLK